MNQFKNISLRRKLISINILVIIIVLIIGFIFIINRQINFLKKKLLNDNLITAGLIAEFSLNPIISNNQEKANAMIQKLASNEEILAGVIFTNNDSLYVSYIKKNSKIEIPQYNLNLGNRFIKDHLHIEYPIIKDEVTHGFIHLIISTKQLNNQINQFIGLIIILIAVLIFISYLLTSIFQHQISRPIKYLVDAATRISQKDDYNLKLTKIRDDEIGQLYDSFNHMIEQIRQRHTDRIKIEKELRSTSTLLETTLNAIPDLIGIQGPDREIIRYNEAGYKFLNKSYEEVKGKKCYELIGRIKPCEICATENVYKTKKPSQVTRFEKTMNLWLDVRAYPILDEKNNVIMVIEHLRDITDIRNTQNALKESENQKKIILSNLNELIIYRNRELETLWVSKSYADYLGRSQEELINRKLQPDEENYDLFCKQENIVQVMKSGNNFKTEKKTSDGKYWHININPVWDEKKKVIGTIEIALDITKLKRAEEKLLDYQDHLEELVKERTKELEEKNKELERMNNLFVGREFRIKELKKRIQELENRNRRQE